MDNTTQVFLRNDPELHLHRDQIRVVNVLRGQSKNDSFAAMDKFKAKIEHSMKIANKKLFSSDNVDKQTNQIADKILQYIADTAPMVIHVSEVSLSHLCNDTHYRSTFETTTKGESYLKSRTQWESECFLKLYDGIKPFERPKYGALNFLNNPEGVSSARAYGIMYFELKNSLRKRITIATGDTGCSRILGVLDFCAHVLVHLNQHEIDELIKIVENKIPSGKDNGSNYREIQIHGEVQLDRDIASLNVPKKMLTSEVVNQFSERFGIPVIGF